jgi:hypothetical protein
VRRTRTRGDIGTGAETRIDQAAFAQIVQRRLIGIEPRRLEQHIAIPVQPQPVQVRENCLDMLGPAARPVDILDPQQERAPPRPRKIMRRNRRKGMAHMQPPRGARREAGTDGRNYGFLRLLAGAVFM